MLSNSVRVETLRMRTHALLKANAKCGRGINAVSFYERGQIKFILRPFLKYEEKHENWDYYSSEKGSGFSLQRSVEFTFRVASNAFYLL